VGRRGFAAVGSSIRDADLILGTTLIDVKFTAYPEEKLLEWLRQIVGYALLTGDRSVNRAGAASRGHHYRWTRRRGQGALAPLFFAAEAADSVTDVAQNPHGLRVQRQYGLPGSADFLGDRRCAEHCARPRPSTRPSTHVGPPLK
jgi:hypothetical protein